MDLSIGIVGLPNVGKSTLFSALTHRQVPTENYPFCTIDPNVGCVAVPDVRLGKLAEIEDSQKTIYATVDFFDIAGLVSGASRGEGLGNQFLANIRETAAIAEVVRAFPDPNVTHVVGSVDPVRDIKIIETELQLADLATVSKRLSNIQNKAKTSDKAQLELETYQKIARALNEGKNSRDVNFSDKEQALVKDLFLLTQKPTIYILNISEDQLTKRDEIVSELRSQLSATDLPASPTQSISGQGSPQAKTFSIIPVCAKLEAELSQMPPAEAKDFLRSYNLKNSALDEIIHAAYAILGMISFFTAGKKEARAWPIPNGTNAQQAAGEIHSDFQKKFIKADIVSYEDFIKASGWAKAYEQGKVRSEGKDYLINDGDVVIFKHG
jgi:GTP-binding protein YchF